MRKLHVSRTITHEITLDSARSTGALRFAIRLIKFVFQPNIQKPDIKFINFINLVSYS